MTRTASAVYEQQEVTAVSQLVYAWFVEATSIDNRLSATDAEVMRIARLIIGFKEYYQRDRSSEKLNDSVLARLREAQKAVHDLNEALPVLLKAYEGGGVDELVRQGNNLAVRKNPEWVALSQLHEASKNVTHIIGDLSQGRPVELWVAWAKALLDPIKVAMTKATGRTRHSPKANTPLIKVLCAALKAIDCNTHEAEKVESGLKRLGKRQRRGRK